MAERKAVNKYYPPDWDPRKGSVNKRVGQHPLRDRAKKLSQGILVIRFELPYNIWCGGCGAHVGMGVRYNAEKSKVGNYYSTPIYKFRMKCHLCDNYFEIQTDPKNHDYVILNGARRKEQRWDPTENGQILTEDKATQKKMATDPMYKLEHGSDDTQKGKKEGANLGQLEEARISMIDDYILNRMARDKFRSEKRQIREAAEAEQSILDRSGLDIELVEESEEDKRLAGLMKYSVTTSFEDKQKEKRKSIEQRPLFNEDKNVSSVSSSSLTSSSSSSSSAAKSFTSSLLQSLSKPVPFQRHVQPKLSRRGEIKQKLGWAIKASHKDPFKAGRDKGMNSNPKSIQKQLGIKLKPITVKADDTNPGLVSSTLNQADSVNDKKQLIKEDKVIRSTIDDREVNTELSGKVHDTSNNQKTSNTALPCTSEITNLECPGTLENTCRSPIKKSTYDSVGISVLNASTSASVSDTAIAVMVGNDFTFTTDASAIQDSALDGKKGTFATDHGVDDTACSLDGRDIGVPSKDVSNNSSGLLNLMSSYGDDSDSNSSSNN